MKIVRNRFKELLAIKERRDGRRYTRREMEAITGVTLKTVQGWANNRATQFHSQQIEAFCEFFECELGDLLILEEVESSPEIETTLAASA